MITDKGKEKMEGRENHLVRIMSNIFTISFVGAQI